MLRLRSVRRFSCTTLASLLTGLAALSASAEGRIGIVLNTAGNDLPNFLTRAGHAALYLSNVCAENAIRARPCKAGEMGSVLNRYPWLTSKTAENYDWLLSPASVYFYGVDDAANAPIIATSDIRLQLDLAAYPKYFSSSIAAQAGLEMPEGKWTTSVGSSFRKALYVFSIKTTDEDDDALIDAINDAPNKSVFNLATTNCSRLVREFMTVAVPMVMAESQSDHVMSIISNLGMTTPKGVSKKVYESGRKDPAAELLIEKVPQMPTTLGRSRDVLFPMENSYRNITYAPWLFWFHPYIPIASLVWHEIISRYDYKDAYRKYAPGVAALSAEKISLDLQLKQIGKQINESGDAQDDSSSKASLKQERQRLRDERERVQGEIKTAQYKVLGSKDDWKAFGARLGEVVRALSTASGMPASLASELGVGKPAGGRHKDMIRLIEKSAKPTADISAGVTIELTVAGESSPRATSLALPRMGGASSGDPALAAFALVAALDYHLDPDDHEYLDMPRFNQLWGKLAEVAASPALGADQAALAQAFTH